MVDSGLRWKIHQKARVLPGLVQVQLQYVTMRGVCKYRCPLVLCLALHPSLHVVIPTGSYNNHWAASPPEHPQAATQDTQTNILYEFVEFRDLQLECDPEDDQSLATFFRKVVARLIDLLLFHRHICLTQLCHPPEFSITSSSLFSCKQTVKDSICILDIIKVTDINEIFHVYLNVSNKSIENSTMEKYPPFFQLRPGENIMCTYFAWIINSFYCKMFRSIYIL